MKSITAGNDFTLALINNVITSVEPVSNSSERTFSIYPNPTKNQITISAIGYYENDFVIKVFTNQGQVVYQKKIKSEETINLEQLTNGMYMIESFDENGNKKISKLIKE